MDARKVETLEKIFGKELAAGVISSAEERTKELEGTTKYKEKAEEVVITLPEITGGTLEEAKAAAIKAVDEAFEKAMKKPMTSEEEAEMKKRMDKKDGDPEPEPKEPVPAFGPEQFTQLATLITDLSSQVEELTGLGETVKALETKVKELSKSDDDKIGDIIAPRWQLPNGMRPTESDKNLITDPKAIKELENPDEGYKDPATNYVMDLLGKAVASN